MNIQNQSDVTYNAVVPEQGTTPGKLASNAVNTEILTYAVIKTLTSDKTTAKPGEIVHNTLTITNNSSVKLNSPFLSDTIAEGASPVEGSVKINGVAQPNFNMSTGFNIPELNPGETITVEYDLKINDPVTVLPVKDASELQYTVTDPVRGEVSFIGTTEPIILNVLLTRLSAVKTVDKAFAEKGDTLTYTVTFTNDGNVDIEDIFFTDKIPAGTTFVENSVYVDGVNMPYRPDVGYKISNLAPAQSATTSFRVTVD